LFLYCSCLSTAAMYVHVVSSVLEMWYSVNVIRPSFTSADVGVILFKGTLRWQYENTVDWGLFEFIFSWPSYDLNPRNFLTNCTIINRHFVPPSKFVFCSGDKIIKQKSEAKNHIHQI
jgi:hypothetical protein